VRRFIVSCALLVLALAAAPPVVAFELTGCQLSVQSSDDNGATIGSASGPGAGGTLADPFLVHPLGIVHYDGRTDTVIMDHTWHVDVYGIPILTGGHDNSGGDTEDVGDVSVAQYAADRLAGLYYVSGALAGTGGSCTGSGWVKLTTDPVGSLPWLIGLVLVALGLLTLYLATPTWRTAVVVERPGGQP
jgi:hypothetical protein